MEDYEAMVPYQMLLMVGHHMGTVCPDKKPGDIVKTTIHDFEGDQTYSEKVGHSFQMTTENCTVNVSDDDALFIPGGRAPEYLRLNKQDLKMTREFAQDKKPIAAVCHGPQILAAIGVLDGLSPDPDEWKNKGRMSIQPSLFLLG